jgi:DtxR family Mn-dependent transcriptional regulator
MVASDDTLLTPALEDYLETIFELVRDQKFARVKEIAKARGVRSGSVTPAMKRLSELEMIRYVQREYIGLTPKGEREARRIYARHQLLTRFFEEILGMRPEAAEKDACAMEHSLSLEGMDRMTRLFEFLRVCPDGKELLGRLHECGVVNQLDPAECQCPVKSWPACQEDREPATSMASLSPGQRARVTHVTGSGATRQRMLDMGILPDVLIEVERTAISGDPIWIKLEGFQLSLRKKEAEAVLVEPI